MTIEKRSNDYGSFDITLKDSDKILSVYLGGDDPILSCKHESYKRISEISFGISESEEELYPIFEKLYNNIVSGNVLDGDLNNPATIKSMEAQRNYTWYKDIVNNGEITIISDAYPVTCPNILRIRKAQSKIELVFIQTDGRTSMIHKNPYSININIRQSGSKSHDFCHPFKTLFKELQDVTETKDIKELRLNNGSSNPLQSN